jgi:hypothetical protein
MSHPQIKELADEVSGKLVCLVSDMINENRKRRLDLYHTIEVAKSDIPKNAKLIECYETDKEYVIIGSPLSEEHNCDEMGCSTVSHVRMRIKKEVDKQEVELKPCPFCGGAATIEEESDEDEIERFDIPQYTIGCRTVLCPGFNSPMFDKWDRSEAIERWNTRK